MKSIRTSLGGELDIFPDLKTHLVPMEDLVEWVDRNKKYATHFEVYFSKDYLPKVIEIF